MKLDNLNLNGVLSERNSLKFPEIMRLYQYNIMRPYYNDVLNICTNQNSEQLSHSSRLKRLSFSKYSNNCLIVFFLPFFCLAQLIFYLQLRDLWTFDKKNVTKHWLNIRRNCMRPWKVDMICRSSTRTQNVHRQLIECDKDTLSVTSVHLCHVFWWC